MRKPKEKKSEIISFKITEALSDRVDKCADRTSQSRASIAEMAITAAVDAIEANDYRLVVPIEFEVKRVPAVVRPEEENKRKSA